MKTSASIMLRQSIITLFIFFVCIDNNSMNNFVYGEKSKHEKLLSRKRRYLLFPEGSSIQLVYCFTIPIYANFVFATTAALAWMLPTHLDDLRAFRNQNQDKDTSRIDKVKTKPIKADLKAGYLSKFVHYNKPVKYRPLHTQFGQPVRYNTISFSPSYRKSFYRKNFQESLPSKKYPNIKNIPRRRPDSNYMNSVYNEYHRRSRRHLFSKIEKFLIAQRKDGKGCLLKAVCEVSQVNERERGTFIQEIIKAIFRVKRSYIEGEDIYDVAANIRQDCSQLYKTCDFSLWDIF